MAVGPKQQHLAVAELQVGANWPWIIMEVSMTEFNGRLRSDQPPRPAPFVPRRGLRSSNKPPTSSLPPKAAERAANTKKDKASKVPEINEVEKNIWSGVNLSCECYKGICRKGICRCDKQEFICSESCECKGKCQRQPRNSAEQSVEKQEKKPDEEPPKKRGRGRKPQPKQPTNTNALSNKVLTNANTGKRRQKEEQECRNENKLTSEEDFYAKVRQLFQKTKRIRKDAVRGGRGGRDRRDGRGGRKQLKKQEAPVVEQQTDSVRPINLQEAESLERHLGNFIAFKRSMEIEDQPEKMDEEPPVVQPKREEEKAVQKRQAPQLTKKKVGSQQAIKQPPKQETKRNHVIEIFPTEPDDQPEKAFRFYKRPFDLKIQEIDSLVESSLQSFMSRLSIDEVPRVIEKVQIVKENNLLDVLYFSDEDYSRNHPDESRREEPLKQEQQREDAQKPQSFSRQPPTANKAVKDKVQKHEPKKMEKKVEGKREEIKVEKKEDIKEEKREVVKKVSKIFYSESSDYVDDLADWPECNQSAGDIMMNQMVALNCNCSDCLVDVFLSGCICDKVGKKCDESCGCICLKN